MSAANLPADDRRHLGLRLTTFQYVVGILATLFAKQDGQPLPRVPAHDEMRLDYKDPYARGGGGPTGGN